MMTPDSSSQGLDELFDGHAGVANERTQEAGLQLGVVRHGERRTSIRWMSQSQVAAPLAHDFVTD